MSEENQKSVVPLVTRVKLHIVRPGQRAATEQPVSDAPAPVAATSAAVKAPPTQNKSTAPKKLSIVRPGATSAAPAPTPAPAVEAPPKPEKNALEEELGILRQHYAGRTQDVALPVPDAPDAAAVLRVSVPMARDFPFDVHDNALEVRLVFPRTYPAALCTVSVTNAEIPATLRAKMDAALAARAAAYRGNPAMASGLLRWLRNQAERLLVDRTITENRLSGITVVAPKAAGAAPPMSILEALHHSRPADIAEDLSGVLGDQDPDSVVVLTHPHQAHRAVTTASTRSGGDDGKKQDDDEEQEQQKDGEEDEDEEKKKKRMALFPMGTAHKGVQLLAEGLTLRGVGFVTCMGLSVVYACTRCNQQDLQVLAPGTPHSDACPRCHSRYTIGFRPEPMHEASNIVGYIDKDGVTPVEVLQSLFVASCLACNADIPDLTLTPGVPHSDNCHQCHARYEILFTRVSMKRVRSPGDDAVAAARRSSAAKKTRDPREAGIRLGTPLPANVCSFLISHLCATMVLTRCCFVYRGRASTSSTATGGCGSRAADARGRATRATTRTRTTRRCGPRA